MTRTEGANLPVVEVDNEFHNLIPSRFPTVKLYERIADGRDDLFYAVEEMTNPRMREKERLTRGLAPVDQQRPRFTNWNHAPFVYPNPEGSRFFGADRNVIELSEDLQTALAISVGKRQAFLRRTAEPATFLEMRQIVRPVRGRCVDARGWTGMDDRARRMDLGKLADDEGHDGILFNPWERPTATGIVVFKPECLGKPLQADHFKYLWNGQRISTLYSFRKGVEYNPDQLGSEGAILAT